MSNLEEILFDYRNTYCSPIDASPSSKNNYINSGNWLKIKIVKRNSRVTYYVDLEGKIKLAHIQELKKFIWRKNDYIFPVIRIKRSRKIKNIPVFEFGKENRSKKIKLEDKNEEICIKKSDRTKRQPDWLNYSKFH